MIPETLPVQFIERVVYLSGVMDTYRPELGGVVACDGRLDDVRLRRALRLMLDAEPVLGCRFVPDAAPPVWRRLSDIDESRLLEVRESEDPSAEAEAFVAEPLDCTAGAQIGCALLRGPDSDTLAVKMTHLAVDGGALKQSLYMIAAFYRILGERPDWTPEPNVDGLRHPLVKAGLLEKAVSVLRSDIAPLPSDWGLPASGGRGPASYVGASVEPHEFRVAAELGKAGGATVNDVILAAYYRVLWRLLAAEPGNRTPLMVSCDVRRHLPPDAATALSNISSAWFVSVPPVADEAFDATLARVVEATRAWKRAGAGRGSAIGVPIVDRLMRKKDLEAVRKMLFGKDNGDPQVGGLTNIGIIDDDLLDFGEGPSVLDAWLLGPVSCQVLGLTASTFRDRLHLTLGVEFAAIPREFVTEVVTGTAAEIGSWAIARGADVA